MLQWLPLAHQTTITTTSPRCRNNTCTLNDCFHTKQTRGIFDLRNQVLLWMICWVSSGLERILGSLASIICSLAEDLAALISTKREEHITIIQVIYKQSQTNSSSVMDLLNTSN